MISNLRNRSATKDKALVQKDPSSIGTTNPSGPRSNPGQCRRTLEQSSSPQTIMPMKQDSAGDSAENEQLERVVKKIREQEKELADGSETAGKTLKNQKACLEDFEKTLTTYYACRTAVKGSRRFDENVYKEYIAAAQQLCLAMIQLDKVLPESPLFSELDRHFDSPAGQRSDRSRVILGCFTDVIDCCCDKPLLQAELIHKVAEILTRMSPGPTLKKVIAAAEKFGVCGDVKAANMKDLRADMELESPARVYLLKKHADSNKSVDDLPLKAGLVTVMLQAKWNQKTAAFNQAYESARTIQSDVKQLLDVKLTEADAPTIVGLKKYFIPVIYLIDNQHSSINKELREQAVQQVLQWYGDICKSFDPDHSSIKYDIRAIIKNVVFGEGRLSNAQKIEALKIFRKRDTNRVGENYKCLEKLLEFEAVLQEDPIDQKNENVLDHQKDKNRLEDIAQWLKDNIDCLNFEYRDQKMIRDSSPEELVKKLQETSVKNKSKKTKPNTKKDNISLSNAISDDKSRRSDRITTYQRLTISIKKLISDNLKTYMKPNTCGEAIEDIIYPSLCFQHGTAFRGARNLKAELVEFSNNGVKGYKQSNLRALLGALDDCIQAAKDGENFEKTLVVLKAAAEKYMQKKEQALAGIRSNLDKLEKDLQTANALLGSISRERVVDRASWQTNCLNIQKKISSAKRESAALSSKIALCERTIEFVKNVTPPKGSIR